jgi:hypothetical protein
MKPCAARSEDYCRFAEPDPDADDKLQMYCQDLPRAKATGIAFEQKRG